MKGLVKIGMTTRDVEKRVYELSQSTGVPAPFTIAHQIYTPDCICVEKAVHNILQDCRLDGREFFSCSVSKAIDIVDKVHVAVLQEFLGEFSDAVALSEEFSAIDPNKVISIADELDVHVMQVNAAISMMTADELRPALSRYFETCEDKKKQRLEAFGLSLNTCETTQ